MRPVSRSAIVLLSLVFLSCSDSSGPDAKTTLDFEDGADDGFTPVTLPATLATGVTFTEIVPSGSFYDFTTADNWGFITCTAAAHSGTKLVGFEGGDTVTGVITFDPPVSRVILFAGTKHGAPISVTAFDAAGAVLDSELHTAACPMLGAADSMSVQAGSKVITKIEIRGLFPAFDDLSFYR